MAERLARSGFDIDLRDGEAREAALVHVFLRARVEHKADHRAKTTGNVFIEYRQPSGPSGISVTTADWDQREINAPDTWKEGPEEDQDEPVAFFGERYPAEYLAGPRYWLYRQWADEEQYRQWLRDE